MNDELKELVTDRISKMGIKKSYLALRMGIDSVRFSQIMAGKRNIQPNELKELKQVLDIQ